MRRRRRRALLLLLLLAGGGSAALLAPPFPEALLRGIPWSPVVTAADGTLLRAELAADGQWRLRCPLSEVSPWLRRATVAVEDRRFRSHPGVDLLAVLRAAWQDLRAGAVRSGASTLSMQLCRMLEPRPRTLAAKVLEASRALRLERRLGKDEILELYLELAPYGGNLRGAEAASRAWFGKAARDLTLAEAALLAGLPQSPERLRPDRHPEAARRRRAEVLDAMVRAGFLGRAEAAAAARTPLGVRPDRDLTAAFHPVWALHPARQALARRPGGGQLLLDPVLQQEVAALARDHLAGLPPGTDLAVAVVDVRRAALVAAVGNAEPEDPLDGQVDGTLAWRSPGSALKPFLYAAAFATGRLAPASPLPDLPMRRAGWEPRNFAGEPAGVVPAAEALRRSLNLAAMRLVEALGPGPCVAVLRDCGLFLPGDPARRAGLGLATGAVEVRLLDLANAWATLARGGAWRPLRRFADEPRLPGRRALPAWACAEVAAILSCRARAPRGLEGLAAGAPAWFAWKTGTSSGRRDAWAAGHNGRWAIAVWVGRLQGGGDPAYVGAGAAEPLLARLFQHPLLRRREADPEPPPHRRPSAPPLVPVPRTSPLLALAAGTPPARGPALRILRPENGATYRALGGRARVPVEVQGTARLWFLDGACLGATLPPVLELGPGQHDLVALADSGPGCRIYLTVRP